MTAALTHRGPDGVGARMSGFVALGHRRLSIIDVAGGAQPLGNEDGRVWVTFNGEIYNYRDLQKDLQLRGHRFRTNCDTEVIVHAYEEWGRECVKRFRGMFAFAVHDERRGEVFLARDRLGIKPLVYVCEPGRVAFASELQSLEALPDVPLEINPGAVDQYLQLKYIPAPETIYKNIYKLPPGHWMTVFRDGRIEGPSPYWNVAFEPEHGRTESDWLEELDAVLREAVRLRLRSDVPFGAFLSGGIDSSLVLAYMAELLEEPVRTFSIGFDEAEFSELTYARQAAQRFNTQHFERLVRPDALGILSKLVEHYGEPFGDSSAIPTYYVSELAASEVKMVLSGDGGDECFAGYHHHLVAAGQSESRGRLGRIAARTMGAARRVGLLHKPGPLEFWQSRMCVFSPRQRQALWRKNTAMCGGLAEPIQACFELAKDWEYCSALQYLDLKFFLPCSVLTKVDIASMLHGLEVRVPLLDHHVVELAARMPVCFKLRATAPGSVIGKLPLRRLAGRTYGSEFFNRAKTGFNVPLREWFQGSRLREIRDRLFDSGSRLTDLFDRAALDHFVLAQKNNSTGSGRPALRLWMLLFLGEWLRQHRHVELPASS